MFACGINKQKIIPSIIVEKEKNYEQNIFNFRKKEKVFFFFFESILKIQFGGRSCGEEGRWEGLGEGDRFFSF